MNTRVERRRMARRKSDQTGRDKMTQNASVKVQGITVDMPNRYAEGHTLTAAEADALNTYFHNRVASLVSGTVKNALNDRKYSDLTADEQGEVYSRVQETVNETAKDFEFGQTRSRGRKPADPVETEAMNIAREMVRRSLKDKGVTLGDVPAKKVSELAKQVLADAERGKKIRQKAKATIKARQELAELDVDVDVDLGEPA